MARRCQFLWLVAALAGATVHGQDNFAYPHDEYLGGGIGYAPTFLQLDIAKSFPFNAVGPDSKTTGLLGGLGFSDDDIALLGNIIVIHGAEGFGNVTGNWRVGAYVGLGANSISRVDTLDRRIDLKTSFMVGSASTEFVLPIFSNLEISAGSFFGFSRAVIQFATTTVSPDWEGQFSGTDSANTMVSVSGIFFTFQPYIAVKLQFLDRVGFRISGGYQVGTLPANKWTLNDFQKILAPKESNFNAPAIRMMLYFGI